MDKIVGIIGGTPDFKVRNDDDFSDRLSYRYTTAILVLFAVLVTTSQLVGDPITCWVPAHFTGNHEAYSNSYCWVRNTYWLPFQEYIPHEEEHDKRHMITYYQWMPLILLVQALLFYMPVMIWRSMNAKSGVDLNSIVEAGETLQNTEKAEGRDSVLKLMCTQTDRFLEAKTQSRQGITFSIKSLLTQTCFRMCGRNRGNYLITLYLFSKLFFIANVVSQIFALNFFLGHQFSMYGLDVISALAQGDEKTFASNHFPRVTMCDFKIRRLGNVQRYTVQCVLPINLFNEKIYLFLWFWMVFVAAMACLSLLSWALRIGFRTDRHRYVKKHLRLMDKLSPDSKDGGACKDFIDRYLKQDGVFILRLVGHNTNAITATEFACALWDNYRSKSRINMDDEDEADV